MTKLLRELVLIGSILVLGIFLWTLADQPQPAGRQSAGNDSQPSQPPNSAKVDRQTVREENRTSRPPNAEANGRQRVGNDTRPPLRALFVGNSLTFYYDMPSMIRSLAAAAGHDRRFEPTLETPGGMNLEGHKTRGFVERLLETKSWDVVVLQEQGQTAGWPAALQTEIRTPAEHFTRLIKENHARPLLYETFARKRGDPENFPGDNFDAMQVRVNANYRTLGLLLSVEVVPAGEACARVRDKYPTIELFDPDDAHPSRAGSYLVACLFYRSIYGATPVGNSYHSRLPKATVEALQSVAASYPIRAKTE